MTNLVSNNGGSVHQGVESVKRWRVIQTAEDVD